VLAASPCWCTPAAPPTYAARTVEGSTPQDQVKPRVQFPLVCLQQTGYNCILLQVSSSSWHKFPDPKLKQETKWGTCHAGNAGQLWHIHRERRQSGAQHAATSIQSGYVCLLPNWIRFSHHRCMCRQWKTTHIPFTNYFLQNNNAGGSARPAPSVSPCFCLVSPVSTVPHIYRTPKLLGGSTIGVQSNSMGWDH